MGYDIRVVGKEFFVARKDKVAALNALQTATDERTEALRWQVKKSEIARAESLREALRVFGWAVEMDDEGNYVDVWYEQEKIGDDFFWHAIAPFIKAGSYIEISGNGGEDRFRYYFDGKTFREQDAIMSWKDRD